MGRNIFWDIYVVRMFDGQPVWDGTTAGWMDRIVRNHAHCGGNGRKVRHMTDKEKQLLDYLYTAGQQIQDFMRRNGYSEKGVFYLSDITVNISPNGEKYDGVSAYVSTTSNREDWRTVTREYNPLKGKSEYGEREWKA